MFLVRELCVSVKDVQCFFFLEKNEHTQGFYRTDSEVQKSKFKEENEERLIRMLQFSTDV